MKEPFMSKLNNAEILPKSSNTVAILINHIVKIAIDMFIIICLFNVTDYTCSIYSCRITYIMGNAIYINLNIIS